MGIHAANDHPGRSIYLSHLELAATRPAGDGVRVRSQRHPDPHWRNHAPPLAPSTTAAYSRSRSGTMSAIALVWNGATLPARYAARRGRRTLASIPRVSSAGIGPGGRPDGEPPVARAGGTVSLLGMSRALRCAPALLGAPSRAGVGLPALDPARLEDEGSGCRDRLERPNSGKATCKGWSTTVGF